MKRIFAITLVLAAMFGVRAAEGVLKIKEVRFEGLGTLTDDLLRTKIDVKPGMAYDQTVVQKDLERLYRTGYFADISSRSKRIGEDVLVIFVVKENPKIRLPLRISGNFDVDSPTIESLVQLKQYGYYSDYLAWKSERDVEEHYRQAGFFNARCRIYTDDEGRVTVDISQGLRPKIKKLVLAGLKTLDQKKVLSEISTRERSYFGLIDQGYFEPQRFAEDLRLLIAHVREQGFPEAKIVRVADLKDGSLGYVEGQEDRLDISVLTREEIELEILVDEGPQYTVGLVKLEGSTIIPHGAIRANMRLKPRERYTNKMIQDDIEMIRVMYGDRGYPNASVAPRISFDLEARHVNYYLNIDAGRRYKIEEINIAGNFKTRDDVIRREILLAPGERYNRTAMEKSIKHLRQLGIFEDVDYEIAENPVSLKQEMKVSVKERETGSYRFGAGVSSEFGVRGLIEIVEENFDWAAFPSSWQDVKNGRAFKGGGQYFRLALQPGIDFSTFDVEFENPWIFDMPIAYGMHGYYNIASLDKHDEHRLGYRSWLEKRWENGMFLRGTGRIENVNVKNVDDSAPLDVHESKGSSTLMSAMLTYGWDRRDDRFDPTTGWIADVSSEFVGGDWSFVKYVAHARQYHTLYKNEEGGKHVLHYGATLGLSSGYMPVFERYYAGGMGSLRGFGYRGAGPSSGNTGIGGRQLYLANVQYEFPVALFRPQTGWDLKGVLFVDAGGATGSYSTLKKDPYSRQSRARGVDGDSVFRISPGFGIRLKMPMLGKKPLALDFAFPAVKGSGDDTQYFHFAIGGNW